MMEDSKKLYKLIDAISASIYWKDRDGIYLGCNQYMLKMAGLNHLSEIVGKTDFQLPWKSIAKELLKIDQQVMALGLPAEFEETPTLGNEETRTFLTSKTPLFDDENNIVGLIGVSMDITDRKRMEKELQEARIAAEASSRAKTEFLQNMRHDLRTPFSGILGISEFMEREETDPVKKENLSYVVQSAKALLDQLDEIFEFIKLESGRLPILERPFNLHKLLADLNRMMFLPAKNKNLEFSVEIDKNVPDRLVGDAIRTQRILMNVVSNAIKFTEKGHVRIHVKSGKKSKGKVLVHFIVEDTGRGIPEDKQDLIFERFNRISPSSQGIHYGSGLGLRIVKQFLDEIGGQPILESELGKGTTFIISVPYILPLLQSIEQLKIDSLRKS